MNTDQLDIDIVHRVIHEDVDDFYLLYQKYQAWVVSILKHHVPIEEVEEVCQEVFVQIYKSLKNFKGKSSFKTWIHPITLRAAYRFWKKNKNYRKSQNIDFGSDHENTVSKLFERNLQQHEIQEHEQDILRDCLENALSQLSAENRMVLQLCYLDGYSTKEVAKLLGWTQVNVLVRSHRSKKKLKKILLAGGYSGQ